MSTKDGFQDMEEKFRLIADFTYDWEYWIGPDGELRYMSPSCERVTGYAPDEFMDNPDLLEKICHPDDLDSFREHSEGLQQTEKIHKVDYRIIRRDDKIRWIGHICQPVYGRDGNYLGRRASNRDITEQKRLESRLHLTQLSFDRMSDALFLISRDSSFHEVNQAACDRLGYSREEMLNLSVYDTDPNPPPDWDEHWHMLKQQGSVTFEAQHQAKDGHLIPVEVTINYVEYEGKEYNLALARDITARKQSEEALRESEEQQRILIENMQDGVFLIEGGNINFCNQAFADMLNYTPVELIGVSIAALIAPEDLDMVMSRYKARLEGKDVPSQYEFHMLCKDDEARVLVNMSVGVVSLQGRDVSLGTVKDITEMRRAQMEREQLQQEIIEAQQRTLKELSTPIIPVIEGIIVLPLIGSIDTQRAREITRTLLSGITDYRAQVVIVDITGVAMVDSGVADHLNKTIQAARLKGARTIVTGISDAVAETIVDLGIDWSDLETVRDLQTGLVVALESMNMVLNKAQ